MSILSHASPFQLQTQTFDWCEGYGSLIIFPSSHEWNKLLGLLHFQHIDLTLFFSFSFRFLKNPLPGDTILFEQHTSFRVAVEQHLKSKWRLPVTIKFRGDAFRHLFKNKGTVKDGWHLLSKWDFPCKYFPQYWDYSADSHGQGVKVFYPMKVSISSPGLLRSIV